MGALSSSLLPPGSQKVSKPHASPNTDMFCKETKLKHLQIMEKKAAEELKRIKSEYRKNPTDHIKQQILNAQKIHDSLLQEIETATTSPTTSRCQSPSHVQQLPIDRCKSSVEIGSYALRSHQLDTAQRGVFTSFSNLRQSPDHLAAFLHFVIVGGHDPSSVFFTMIAEDYAGGSTAREMNRWASEIYATFLASHAPLVLNMDSGMVSSIKQYLMSSRNKENELTELKSLFLPSLHFIQMEVNSLVSAFREQKIRDGELDDAFRCLVSHDDEQIMTKKYRVNLWKIFREFLIEKSTRKLALASCLAGFFQQSSTVDFEVGSAELIESCATFIARDKKAWWPKSSKKNITLNGHSLSLVNWFDVANCDICNDVIWTAFNDGYHCSGCGSFTHKNCMDMLKPVCSGTIRSRSKDRLLRSAFETETQLSKAARRASSTFHVDLPVTDATNHVNRNGEGGDEPRDLKKGGNKSSSRDVFGNISPPIMAGSTKLSTGQSFASARKKAIHGDSDMDVEPELPALDTIIPKEEMRKLKNKERKLQEVINELFYTERVHVCKLKVIYKFFFKPMKDKKLVGLEFLKLLFPNPEDLINIHRNISKDFKARRSESVVISRVGDIFLKHFSGEHGERMHQSCAKFCRDQSHALDRLRSQQRREPKLATFLQEAASNPLCGRQELRDLLLCEMQRLVKYPLLIENLLKYTQQDTPEYSQLLRAYELSRDLLHFVNEEVREQENWRKTLNIMSRLDKRPIEQSKHPVILELMPLVLTQHRLIYHDSDLLTWRVTSGKMVEVSVALFADIILLLQPQDEKLVLRCQSILLVPGVETSRISHSPIIKLRDLLVRDNAADKCALFLISLSRDKVKNVSQYDLVAKTKEIRKKWFNLINNAVIAYKKEPPGVYVHTLRSDDSFMDAESSNAQVTSPDDRRDRSITSSLNSLDIANCLMEPKVVQPELILPTEVTCNIVTQFAESVVQPAPRLSSVTVKRKLSSVYSKLSEKRKWFAKALSYSEDETDSVFGHETSFEDWDPPALIAASVEQVKMLQRLLNETVNNTSPSPRVMDDSGFTSPLYSNTRGILSSSDRSRIAKQLEYHEELLMSWSRASESERDRLLADLQESQGEINRMIDAVPTRFNRAISYAAATSESMYASEAHCPDGASLV